MVLLIHFNELSIAPAGSQALGARLATTFAEVLVEAKRRRGDVALMSDTPLAAAELATHFTLGDWGRAAANRDQWRVVRWLQNRAPGWHRDPDDSSVEYNVNAQTARGLAHAHMSDGISISLDTDVLWSTPWLTVKRRSLVESNSGAIELVEADVMVRHTSEVPHLEQHIEWVSLAGMADIESGVALAETTEAFGSLRFLPQAVAQLRSLDSAWVGPVSQQLALMNRAVVEWEESAAHPSWYSYVTPDSQRRRDRGLLDFTDADGVVRTFDLHARFTPGAGRIHFRLSLEDRVAVIAYVGSKIE